MTKERRELDQRNDLTEKENVDENCGNARDVDVVYRKAGYGLRKESWDLEQCHRAP